MALTGDLARALEVCHMWSLSSLITFFSKRVLVIVGDHKNRPSIKSSDRNSGGRDGHKAAKGREPWLQNVCC